ncbi:PAS domain S-box protein [Candidatus Roizmanbacteria bacterium]|nr:PAS domain S-box protein [Candidatus Roizmanbacteria bacterium]
MSTNFSLQETLDKLRPVFAKAAVGDFSEDLPIPDLDDETAELYAGIQIMVDVIRSKISSLEEEIARRTTIESNLRRREEEIRALVENSPNVIARFDHDLKHVYINSAITEITGKKPEEFIGKTNHELGMPQDQADYWAKSIRSVFENGKEIVIEYQFQSPTGIRYFQSRIVPEFSPERTIEYVLGVTYDITDLKHTQLALVSRTKALMREKARVEALLSSMGEGIIVFDLDTKITFINNNAEQLLGWKQNEALGKEYSEVIDLVDASGAPIPVEERPYTTVLKNRQIVRSNDYYCVRKNGNSFAISLTAAPVIIEGNLVGTIDVLRDISQEKETERLKTEFISIAAHQLRTPLGIIRWNLELLIRDSLQEQSPKISKFIEQTYPNIIRMTHLINDLLNVSRIEQGPISTQGTPVDVFSTIQTVVKELTMEAQRTSLTIRVDKPEQVIPPLTIEPIHLQSILQNIIGNAIKYNRENGTVTITPTYQTGEFHVVVQDSGIGIPIKEQGKLFSRFFRAQNALNHDANGNGLGLYVARKFAEHWGGRIFFSSQEGVGSTFTLVLPEKLDKKEDKVQ